MADSLLGKSGSFENISFYYFLFSAFYSTESNVIFQQIKCMNPCTNEAIYNFSTEEFNHNNQPDVSSVYNTFSIESSYHLGRHYLYSVLVVKIQKLSFTIGSHSH